MVTQLLSNIQGKINNVNYSASGSGVWNGEYSESIVKFDRDPLNFPVMYGKSWQCSNHPSIARIMGGINSFSKILDTGYSITGKCFVTFSGIHGQIDVSVKIQRDGSKQLVSQNRSGYFDGPQDVVKQLDYVHHFIPKQSGVVSMVSNEQVVLSTGTIVDVRYEWEYKIPVLFDFEPFKVDYHIRHSSYSNRQFKIGIAPKAFLLNETPVNV